MTEMEKVSFKTAKSPKIQVVSNGKWGEDGQLRGQVQVKMPSYGWLNWNIFGEANSPSISPSVQMMKQLAQKKSKLKLPKDLAFESCGSTAIQYSWWVG